jgi:hypothetical protein
MYDTDVCYNMSLRANWTENFTKTVEITILKTEERFEQEDACFALSVQIFPYQNAKICAYMLA